MGNTFNERGDELGTEAEAPQKPRVGFCRKAAAQVLKRADISDPPVDLNRVANNLGIELRKARLPRGLDARLRLSAVGRVVEFAEDQAFVRVRFSIAHEIGHFVLGHAHTLDASWEPEANIFAGALLVPRTWLKKATRVPTAAEALARQFQVSRDVIFIACKDASLLNQLV